MRRFFMIWVWSAVVALGVTGHAEDIKPGADVVDVFARARQGAPLRYVALGGSITQAGEGWIGDWLAKQFPKSAVSVVNSGMSATGSQLGIFRVERDVIAYQPDLVAIEYCVNDGGLADEQAVRYMESLIVRLKSLPHPPAIIILEAAARPDVNLSRHRKVARHYGLLEVDLQTAVNEALRKNGKPWAEWFSDNVHPNKAGHEFYSQAIAATLTPLFKASASSSRPAASTTLPAPLSRKPLILDGRMIALSGVVAGTWKRETTLPFWWDRFFLGTIGDSTPGSGLTLPLRGTMLGLLYAMDTSYGTFFTNVDGAMPNHVFANTRGGYGYVILGEDLTPQEHVLQMVLPATADPVDRLNGPVKLGYALVAGETGAGAERAAQGKYTAGVLGKMMMRTIPARDWAWTGYQPLDDPKATDAKAMLAMPLASEGKMPDASWQKIADQPDSWIDLHKLTDSDKPGVAYLATTIDSPRKQDVLLGFAADYYAKLWVNGELIVTFDGPHGSPKTYRYFPVTLRAGKNDVRVKVCAGSAGFGCALVTITLPK